MVQKVNDKHIMDCEVKVLIRKRNATNEEVYTELKSLVQASYGSVWTDCAPPSPSWVCS